MFLLLGFTGYASYSLFTFGLSQIRGCNAGLVEISIPGRYKGCNPDKPATAQSSSTSAVSIAKTATGSATGTAFEQQLNKWLGI